MTSGLYRKGLENLRIDLLAIIFHIFSEWVFFLTFSGTRDELYLCSPFFIPWKVAMSEVQILETSAEESFVIITFSLFRLTGSLTSFPAYSGSEDGRRSSHAKCGYIASIPNIPRLALCELWVLCYFLIARTSLFFLLRTDGKRYKKIIKVLINGSGIFSIIKLALLNRSSCLHLSGDSEVPSPDLADKGST